MTKKKQEVKLKEPVRIRFKQLANGNQSIYLDYYTGDVIRKENYVGGKRQYEFLKLYLIPEKTREDKTKNEAFVTPYLLAFFTCFKKSTKLLRKSLSTSRKAI
jgi:hypothetical protein